MITGLKGVETLVGEGEGAEDWYSQYHRCVVSLIACCCCSALSLVLPSHGEIERKLKELSDTYKEYTKVSNDHAVSKCQHGRCTSPDIMLASQHVPSIGKSHEGRKIPVRAMGPWMVCQGFTSPQYIKTIKEASYSQDMGACFSFDLSPVRLLSSVLNSPHQSPPRR